MHAIVLGAGVVGMTTAYSLAERDVRVTVIDRNDGVAYECSHANGGQLSYSFAESLATPAFLAKLPRVLAGRNFAQRIHLTAALIPWGLRFLLQCTSRRSQANTLALLETASASARLLDGIRAKTNIDFSYRPAGKLVLLATDAEARVARESTRFKRTHGINVEMLSAAEAIAIEPAIENFTGPIVAAAYSQTDEVADAFRFSDGLHDYLSARGVEFRMGTTVTELRSCSGAVNGVRCGGQEYDADAVVVCLGAGSTAVLRDVGIRTGIYPVRGYSVTLPAGDAAPSASVTTLTNRFVFSRLNGDMRIAGFTDFDGLCTRTDDARVATLLGAARRLAPKFADYDSAHKHPWGGFRPMTPSGRPLVGATKVPGLFLNTGHGMLGWTLACATADAVADAVVKTPA